MYIEELFVRVKWLNLSMILKIFWKFPKSEPCESYKLDWLLLKKCIHTAIKNNQTHSCCWWHKCWFRDKYTSGPKTLHHSWDTPTVTNTEKIFKIIPRTRKNVKCCCLNFGKLKTHCCWYFLACFRLSIKKMSLVKIHPWQGLITLSDYNFENY